MMALEAKNSNLQLFRQKLKHYCKLAGYSQKSLAAEVGLHPVTLSNKLNLVAHYELTYTEIKRLLTVLADWGGLVKQAEVVELLELAGLTAAAFTPEEWKQPPLSDLEKNTPRPANLPLETTKTTFQPTAPTKPLAPKVPAFLPSYPTSLIGRKQELATCTGLLQRSEVRLLTLTGPGGVGKTRLAAELAHTRRADFRNGAYFINLATVYDALTLTRLLLSTFGLEETKNPAGEMVAANLAVLKDYLQEQHLLLVLDNFEQVVSAAPALGELIAVAPGLKIITTSRILLQLYGEYEFVVPPLGLPTAEKSATEPISSEAVTLFVQRAKAAKTDFALTDTNAATITEICRLLDGLPLALELAAARIRLLSPSALLSKLGTRLNVLTGGAQDLPERHQSLRNTLEWSYDLLDESEKPLFYRLAVFIGDFSLQAAEQVLETEKGELVFDGLNSLLGKSLLQRVAGDDENRYQMLGLIRDYAAELLAKSGEQTSLRSRHALYYAKLAAEVALKLNSAEQSYWLNYLEKEYANLLAAFDWLGADEAGLRLMCALENFWLWRGRLNEGRQYVQKVLGRLENETSGQAVSPYWRARAYLTAASLAAAQHEHKIAREYCAQSIKLNETLQDKAIQAAIFSCQGDIALYGETSQAAQAYYEASLALYKELNDKIGQALSLQNLAVVIGNEDVAAGRNFIEAGIALWREVGHKVNLCRSLNIYSVLLSRQGELGKIRQTVEEAILLGKEVGNIAYLQVVYANMLARFIKQGQYEPAIPVAEEAQQLAERTGNKVSLSYVLHHYGTIKMMQEDYPAAQELLEKALQLRQAIANPLMLAYSYNSLGMLATLRGNLAEAAQWLEQSLNRGRELSDATATSGALLGLTRLAYAQENYNQAKLYLEQAFPILSKPTFSWSAINGVAWLALVAAKSGQAADAVCWGSAAKKLAAQTGNQLQTDAARLLEQMLHEQKKTLAAEVFAAAQAAGEKLTIAEIYRTA